MLETIDTKRPAITSPIDRIINFPLDFIWRCLWMVTWGETLVQKFDQVTLHRKPCLSPEALHPDLNEWIPYYNERRTHQDKMCCGHLPDADND